MIRSRAERICLVAGAVFWLAAVGFCWGGGQAASELGGFTLEGQGPGLSAPAAPALNRKEAERMSSLKSYLVRVGESYYDLMKESDSARLESFFSNSRINREAYKQVATIKWTSCQSLQTNLVCLVQFPSPIPTQLRANAERLLMAMTNSPAVSFALRRSGALAELAAPDWEIGNLNASCLEDMETLLDQLEQYPEDGAVYVRGLLELFQSAKGYFGPDLRRDALQVYMRCSSFLNDKLRQALRSVADNTGVQDEIRRAALAALEALDTIWIVTVNARQYDLKTPAGLEAFLRDGNVRTHYMDQLALFHAIVVHGPSHAEIQGAASWLTTNRPARFQLFLQNLLAWGDGPMAKQARQINYELLQANGLQLADGSAPEGPADATQSNIPPLTRGGSVRLAQLKNWVINHLGYLFIGLLLAVASIAVFRLYRNVQFGRKRLRKEILYPVADQVMEVVKTKASERLEAIAGELEHLLKRVEITQAEFVAQHADRPTLEYLVDRVQVLCHQKVFEEGRPIRERVIRYVEKNRPDREALADLLVDNFPREIIGKGVNGPVLRSLWSNRVLARNAFWAGELLNKQLLELHEKAARFRSVAELGRQDDNYPAPREVVETMKSIGVDVGQVIDRASKGCVTAWEPRYLMNRNPDLVIAAYYKRHFNRFIELADAKE